MLGFWRELTDASRDCRDAMVSACRQHDVRGRQSERGSLATATVVDWAETTGACAGLGFLAWDHSLIGAAVGILPTFVSTSPARRPPTSEVRRPNGTTRRGLASVAPPPRSGRGADSLPTPARLLLDGTLLPLSCDVVRSSLVSSKRQARGGALHRWPRCSSAASSSPSHASVPSLSSPASLHCRRSHRGS
jgi:hypothetical protein